MDMLPGLSHLSNLGIFFKHRFAHSGQLVDIDNTINAQEQAVRLTPDGHITKPGYLHNLGNSLFSRSNYQENWLILTWPSPLKNAPWISLPIVMLRNLVI